MKKIKSNNNNGSAISSSQPKLRKLNLVRETLKILPDDRLRDITGGVGTGGSSNDEICSRPN